MSESSTSYSQFIKVGLPFPIPSLFTYVVPASLAMSVHVGSRVIVPFGKKRFYTGVIFELIEKPKSTDSRYDIKEIIDIVEDNPIVYEQQLSLYRWIADYYMCTIGDVLKVAIPSGLKLSSESIVQLNPEIDTDEWHDAELNDHEHRLMDALSNNGTLSYQDISLLLGIKKVIPIIKSLASRRLLFVLEQIKDKYTPKKIKKIWLNKDYYETEDKLEELFHSLEKKQKQLEVLLLLLKLQDNPVIPAQKIDKSTFNQHDLSKSALNTLIKKNILIEGEFIIPRFQFKSQHQVPTIELSENQSKIFTSLEEQFEKKHAVLLHGITGSGKTEIYIELIKKHIKNHGQVLFLMPEIALTVQIIERLKTHFGNLMGVYHSKYSDNERVEVWNGVFTGKYQLVVGVRSSVFLPFENLKLVIVDEEHETTFKQQEPAPKYNARDIAITMCSMFGAKCLLGSATPSLDSWFNAKTGKFGFAYLNERYGKATLPQIEIVKLGRKNKNKFIAPILLQAIEKALSEDEQTLIFQNRRGYSPYLTCNTCSETTKCIHCAVSLTYHHRERLLKCHYCGYVESVPKKCHYCNSTDLSLTGFGTEKLEEELSLIFKDSRVERMDYDTTRSKLGYNNIIDAFAKKEIDILVGTQMITKGLDFEHVNLVGVTEIDRLINFPDFRSSERALQTIIQIAGRSGRREKQGKVIIQSNKGDHEVIRAAIRNDINGFYEKELSERRHFRYPPYYRLIKVVFKSSDLSEAQKTCEHYLSMVRNELGTRSVIGPNTPIIEKIRNQFVSEGLIKIEKGKKDLSTTKRLLIEASDKIRAQLISQKVFITFDVDPY